MRKSTAIVLGVAGVALAVTASSAFTASGVTFTDTTQFVGGTASQTVTGATVSSVVYRMVSGTSNVDRITLTFADATGGATPTVTVTGTENGGTAGGLTCGAIDSSTYISTCNPTTSGHTFSDISAISVTVA